MQDKYVEARMFKRQLLEGITDKDFNAIVNRLKDLCFDANKRISLDAIKLVFERVIGKASQPIEVGVNTKQGLDASLYTDEQLASMLAILDSPSAHTHAAHMHQGQLLLDGITIDVSPEGEQSKPVDLDEAGFEILT